MGEGWEGDHDNRPRFARLSTRLANFLFPPRCVVCRARGNWLCARCRPRLDLFAAPVCPRCGMPVDPGCDCEWCRHRQLGVDAIRACGYFDGPLRDAIHRFKFGRERYLAVPLAGLMARAWQRSPLEFDVLVPVPLTPRREAERGYNQSALLAKELGSLLQIPIAEPALKRVRETPPQVGLPREQRLANLKDAFGAVPAHIDGRRVCLVDDVTTTGATLTACANALRAAGTSKVCSLVIARTR